MEDCDEGGVRYLEWLHSRLVKQKSNEKELMQKNQEKKNYRVEFKKAR